MIIIRYSKQMKLSYVSHLDMQKTIIRTVNRAGYKCEYTSGFTPRPILKMSKPLSLGVSSIAEYFALDVNCQDVERFIDLCNKKAPSGMSLMKGWIRNNDPNLFYLGHFSQYKISTSNEQIETLKKAQKDWEKSFIINKKSKKAYIKEDVSNLIKDSFFDENNMYVTLVNSEQGNLRIIDFIDGINSIYGVDLNLQSILKTEQYVDSKDTTIDDFLNQDIHIQQKS